VCDRVTRSADRSLQITVIARVAHVMTPDTMGIAFLSITEPQADQMMHKEYGARP
jgi:hypothetical protein